MIRVLWDGRWGSNEIIGESLRSNEAMTLCVTVDGDASLWYTTLDWIKNDDNTQAERLI